MKNAFFIPIVGVALTAISFITPPNPLVGRWQQKVKGDTALLVFRTNDTFDVFINGKVFTSGRYTVRQDTFALADPACNATYFGSYTLSFVTPDSVRFTAIADTCQGRKGDLHNLTAGRVRLLKP